MKCRTLLWGIAGLLFLYILWLACKSCPSLPVTFESEGQTLLQTLKSGWTFWVVIFYLSSVLVVLLPALVTAEVAQSERCKKWLGVSAVVIAGLVVTLQPGFRATRHEHAYLCFKAATFNYDAIVEKSKTDSTIKLSDAKIKLAQSFSDCQNSIDYEYVDGKGPGKSLFDENGKGT